MKKQQTIGLTGSIGMGKSTVAAMFERHGVPVFDADAEVRAMQGRNGELIGKIEEEFPGSTGANGVIREALGQFVFGNPDALARLEAIVHPMVALKRERFMAINHNADLVLYDIPLLFEKGGNKNFDVVIVVSAPASVQKKRVLAREGMTTEKLDQILKLQSTDSSKRRLADYIIDTSQTLEQTEAVVVDLISRLKSRD